VCRSASRFAIAQGKKRLVDTLERTVSLCASCHALIGRMPLPFAVEPWQGEVPELGTVTVQVRCAGAACRCGHC
jgi:hypothetical protein